MRSTGKIRNLKAMGKKPSELSLEEQPCNFAEAKKIFAKIVNYKATFEVFLFIYCRKVPHKRNCRRRGTP